MSFTIDAEPVNFDALSSKERRGCACIIRSLNLISLKRERPAEIVHGCDYDFQGRRLDYYYNFIGYRWKLSDRDFYAKTYLDRPRYLSITISLAKISGDPAFKTVLRWLERRFPYIYTLESNGYVLQYKARYAPEPKDF